jgi:hypothetical protein
VYKVARGGVRAVPCPSANKRGVLEDERDVPEGRGSLSQMLCNQPRLMSVIPCITTNYTI